MKPPRRIFKCRRAPKAPPEVEKLRDAHKVINPKQTYRIQATDGTLMEFTGAELIETADNAAALVDAMKAGDERAQKRAAKRILDELK